MGAPEIIRLVGDPDNYERALRLALTWPSLAAALAELCTEHDTEALYPLRVAATAVRSEGYVGDLAVTVFSTRDKKW